MSKPCPATWELTLIFIRKGFLERGDTGAKKERIDRQEKREKEQMCTRERHMQCVSVCGECVCAHMYRQLLKVQATAKGCESRTDLTYRGQFSHLFQAMVNNSSFFFFPCFFGGVANSVCFIPRLTACWVIYS